MPKVVNCRKSIINYWVSSLIASLSSEWLYKVIIFTWWASILSKILNWHHMFSKTKNQTVDAINPAWRFSLKRKFSSLSCETRWAIYVVRIFFCRVMWSCQSPACRRVAFEKMFSSSQSNIALLSLSIKFISLTVLGSQLAWNSNSCTFTLCSEFHNRKRWWWLIRMVREMEMS